MNLIFENGQIIPFKPIGFYEVFGESFSFLVDENSLELKYFELQKQVHPDQFSSQAQAQQMHALQWGSYINEAYETLTLPVKRAVYMLYVLGEEDVLKTHKIPNEVMTQQFIWREMLEDLEDIKPLKKEVKQKQKEIEEELVKAFDEKDISLAKDLTVTLQFVTKFNKEFKKKKRK